jgi:FkbM family methyltransferase
MTKRDIRKIIATLIPPSLRKLVPPKFARHLYFKGTIPVIYRGEILLKLQANGYPLENEIFFYGLEGGHERRSMEIWIEFCEKFKPKHVYDIGANTGIYGLVAKALYPKIQVSFFEPITKAVEILRTNLELNCYAANVFSLALSNYDGVGHFYMENNSDFAYSVTLNTFTDLAITGSHKENLTLRKIETQVAQICTLLIQGAIEKPNLVKIDVETHEHEVLEGFKFDLNEVDAYLIEVLNETVATKLNAMFFGLDFRFFNINDSQNTVVETASIRVSEQYNYFVVKPRIASEMRSLFDEDGKNSI